MVELYESDIDANVRTDMFTLNDPSPLSKKQKSFLNLAIRLAETSELAQQHGAVIVKGGSVLSLGVNKWRNKSVNPPVDGSYNPHLSYHAEVDAINHANSDLNGATVYVARIGKDGTPRFSRPCSRCTQALKAAGVKKVVYTS